MNTTINNENFVSVFKNLFKTLGKVLVRSGSVEIFLQKPQRIIIHLDNGIINFSSVNISVPEEISEVIEVKFHIAEFASVIDLFAKKEKFSLSKNQNFDRVIEINGVPVVTDTVLEDRTLFVPNNTIILPEDSVRGLIDGLDSCKKKLKKGFAKEMEFADLEFITGEIRVISNTEFEKSSFSIDSGVDISVQVDKSEIKVISSLFKDDVSELKVFDTKNNDVVFEDEFKSLVISSKNLNQKMYHPTRNSVPV
jgi:hypothetical protein